nr:hypothetical protein [Tanacetum cinerariifolium]
MEVDVVMVFGRGGSGNEGMVVSRWRWWRMMWVAAARGDGVMNVAAVGDEMRVVNFVSIRNTYCLLVKTITAWLSVSQSIQIMTSKLLSHMGIKAMLKGVSKGLRCNLIAWYRLLLALIKNFPLPEELPTASEDGSHCQKKRDATARKIALLSKTRKNCQSKKDGSYTKVERLKEENRVLKELESVHSKDDSDEPVMEIEKSSKQERKIADIDADVEINLEKVQAEAYYLDLDHQKKVLSMMDVNDEKPADVEEVLEVVKSAKLITKVVTTFGVDVNAASIQDTPITMDLTIPIRLYDLDLAKIKTIMGKIPILKTLPVISTEATKVSVPRNKRGVIIQDPEETTTTVTVQPKVQAKDKRKAILIEEPKPLKRQAQIKLDGEVVRQLEAELNANINWNVVIEQVQRREKLTDAVMKYQALKRKPLIEAQARRNMIVCLKNMAGYKMDYFKGMCYDEIRPFFEKNYNYNQAFLNEPNVEANTWKDQKGKYGLAKVKRWKLFESCGVYCLTLSTTHIFLLSERMYYLTHFTLEQMMNDVRLEVEDESEMSLELLRLVRRQLNERYVP